MSEPERIFFATLRKAVKLIDARLYVCPKIRVMDVINCSMGDFKDGGYVLGQLNLDFVVVDVYDRTVKFCIEYDDKRYENFNRKERDFYLNMSMEKAGVKLLRVPYKKTLC